MVNTSFSADQLREARELHNAFTSAKGSSRARGKTTATRGRGARGGRNGSGLSRGTVDTSIDIPPVGGQDSGSQRGGHTSSTNERGNVQFGTRSPGPARRGRHDILAENRGNTTADFSQSPSPSQSPVRHFAPPRRAHKNWNLDDDVSNFFLEADQGIGVERGTVIMYQDDNPPLQAGHAQANHSLSGNVSFPVSNVEARASVMGRSLADISNRNTAPDNEAPVSLPVSADISDGITYKGYYQDDAFFKDGPNAIWSFSAGRTTVPLNPASRPFHPSSVKMSHEDAANPQTPASHAAPAKLNIVLEPPSPVIHKTALSITPTICEGDVMELDTPVSGAERTSLAAESAGPNAGILLDTGDDVDNLASESVPPVTPTCTCASPPPARQLGGLSTSTHSTRPNRNHGAFSHIVGTNTDPTAASWRCPVHGLAVGRHPGFPAGSPAQGNVATAMDRGTQTWFS